MASYEIARPAPFGAITIHRVVSRIDASLRSLRLWNGARRTRNAMSALSPELLEDIGFMADSDARAMFRRIED